MKKHPPIKEMRYELRMHGHQIIPHKDDGGLIDKAYDWVTGKDTRSVMEKPAVNNMTDPQYRSEMQGNQALKTVTPDLDLAMGMGSIPALAKGVGKAFGKAALVDRAPVSIPEIGRNTPEYVYESTKSKLGRLGKHTPEQIEQFAANDAKRAQDAMFKYEKRTPSDKRMSAIEKIVLDTDPMTRALAVDAISNRIDENRNIRNQQGYADGGNVQGQKMDTPSIAQMRLKLNQRKNPDFADNIGLEQAIDMSPKMYVNPDPKNQGFPSVGGVSDRNGLPVGGIDQDMAQQGQQLMPIMPQPQQGQDQGQQGGLPVAGQPAPQGGDQQMGNMLSLTPQGQAMQAMQPPQGGMAKGGSAYAKAPHSLMGYKKEGPHKSFNESNYKHTAYVKVHHGTDQHVDAIKGLNHSHAMARAKLNWPTSTRIESISEQEAGKIDPNVVKMAKGGKVSPKQMAAIKAKMMMAKRRPKHMAEGGEVDDEEKKYVPTSSPKRILFSAKGHGDVKGIVVPKHMWEGAQGVYEKGSRKGKKFKIKGMKDINKARAEVYGAEKRDPLTIGQVGKAHKEHLKQHFAKPLDEQLKAEHEALARLRAAKHIGQDSDTLDESEKLDTVRHERDKQGRAYVGYASKGVAGHSLYTSGHGEDSEHHAINTCPGQTVGCGGGRDEHGIIDTSKDTCFAPNAESQYVHAAIRRASHEQAKHDPAMTRDWILAHTSSLRNAANKADKKNLVTLFRPNVVDETDVSSRHVIKGLNEQRKAAGKRMIIANSYGKTNELHDPENGYYVTHSNVGPKTKHGSKIAENIARDKQRVRSTIYAADASGKDFKNDEGNKTPPKNSYMVTNVKRNSALSKEMQKHIKHAKYWSTGREEHELSKSEREEPEHGHYNGKGEPVKEHESHYGHTTLNGKRYDYQRQHILHPRLVQVGHNDDGTPHMIPTDSRFKDEEFLPKKRFKTKNGKDAGAILMTTPTESTSNHLHHSSFTHDVSMKDIEHARKHKGEYEIDSPAAQEAASKEYIPPQPITIVRKADGGSISMEYDDDFNAFPERNFMAQHHLANRVGVEDEYELHPHMLQRAED